MSRRDRRGNFAAVGARLMSAERMWDANAAGGGATPSESAKAAELIARIESVPFSRWHIRPRVIMGSATFFDAFTALSLASATPVLVRLWNLTPGEVGYLLAASYFGQFSRAHGRGRFCLLYDLIFPIGFLAAAVAGAQLVPVYGWNILFLLGTVPGLIITYMVSRLPESPRWLIRKGRYAEAEAIIRGLEASTSKRSPVAAQPLPVAA